MKTKLSKVSCKYGAPMGRPNSIPSDMETVGKLHLETLRWVDYDYDQGGIYWGRVINNGIGDYIYRASAVETEIFVRAYNRQEAKGLVKIIIPSARFYR